MARKYSTLSKFREKKTKNRMPRQNRLKKLLLRHQSRLKPHPHRDLRRLKAGKKWKGI